MLLTLTSSRFTTFLTLMLLCYDGHCASDIVQAIYRRLEEGVVYSSSSRASRHAQSLTDCAVQCRGLKGCSGIEFEPSGRTCYLHIWPQIKVPGNGSNTTWIASDAALILATRQDGAGMTYDEAVDLCSSLEARLPSPQEMYDALDAGLNLCRCGWTQGGIIRLVLTQSDPDCPKTYGGKGVISCKWLTNTQDTFCKWD